LSPWIDLHDRRSGWGCGKLEVRYWDEKAPAAANAIRAMLEHVPDTLIGKRDRAILLIGFGAALRRSEVAALTVGDIERQPDGVLVHIRRSKTDQEGEGAQIPIPRGG
jgi:integrase